MTQTIDTEVLLAGLYAVFLLLVALGLELVARHAHHRSKQMRIAGFRYHRHHDFGSVRLDSPSLPTMRGVWFGTGRRRTPAMLARSSIFARSPKRAAR